MHAANHQTHMYDLSQLPALRARVRRHVDSVIRCMPDERETKAYCEAVERDADLVQTETDPLQFVRYCGYNLYKGAKRLCLYWTERLKLFGPDRAFLPLTLTGTGALTKEDVRNLYGGYPSLLPDTKSGHKCILFDKSKLIPGSSLESKMRGWFYLESVLASSDISQVDGAFAIYVAATPRHYEVDWEGLRQASYMVANVFPVRHKVVLVSIPIKKKPFLAAGIVRASQSVMKSYFDTEFHCFAQAKAELLVGDLQPLGFTKENIPKSFGGEWKFEDFKDWVDEQKLKEAHMYKDRLLKEPPPTILTGKRSRTMDETKEQDNELSAGESLYPTTHDTRDSDHDTERKGITSSERERILQERKAKKRLSNLIASRQKREREQNRVAKLQTDSAQLKIENEGLRLEHGKLSSLVEEAEEIVASLLGGN